MSQTCANSPMRLISRALDPFRGHLFRHPGVALARGESGDPSTASLGTKTGASLQLATEGDIQIAFRTAFRSAGRTACSNHGCFRIQMRLLQLGCGSGKY